MSQEEIFQLVYERYKHTFPDMLHGSGGLPDVCGPGTSDVDICLYHEHHDTLRNNFPEDTVVDSTKPDRTIYTLSGYDREVNIYCSNAMYWNNGALHRNTELSLNTTYPALAAIAYMLKKLLHLSTEQAWARVLNLGDDYATTLLDTQRVLGIAHIINEDVAELMKRLPTSETG